MKIGDNVRYTGGKSGGLFDLSAYQGQECRIKDLGPRDWVHVKFDGDTHSTAIKAANLVKV